MTSSPRQTDIVYATQGDVPSEISESVSIDIPPQTPGNGNDSNHSDGRGEQMSFRWDNVFTGYMLSIGFTVLQFAGSHDSSFTRMCLSASFIHFGFETNQSLHFTFSGKYAYYLGTTVIAIHIIEAVATLIASRWLSMDFMMTLFVLQFVPSDTFSFLSSICLMFNKAMPSRIRVMALMVALHFALAAFSLYILPVDLFFAKEYTTKSQGAAWVYIGSLSLFQIWFCRDVIRGELNYIGPVRYDETKNSKNFILFAKYGAPLLALMAPVVVVTMKMYSSIGDESPGPEFARWIWDDFIFAMAWPEGVVGIMLVLYLRSTPFEHSTNQKA